jgi:glutamate racemase
MKIGVFDSGVGGRSVARAIQKALKDAVVVVREDKANLPYGTKTPEQLLKLVSPIISGMVSEGCDIIVIACNTVSTTIILELREQFDVPLIAVEPMVKPAAERSKKGIIAVCATPTTLASGRYLSLKRRFAEGATIIEPNCSDWAMMIETNQVDHDAIEHRITEVLDAGADVIVLGCTHYHWIEDEIVALAKGKAIVLQPEPAIINQVKRVIGQLRRKNYS